MDTEAKIKMNRHEAQMLARKIAIEHGHKPGRIQAGYGGLVIGRCKLCNKDVGAKWNKDTGWQTYGQALKNDCISRD